MFLPFLAYFGAISVQNGLFGPNWHFWPLGDQTDQWDGHLGSFWGQNQKKIQKIQKIIKCHQNMFLTIFFLPF